METAVLTDPDVYPTTKVLHSHLGKASSAFESMLEFNHTQFPDFVERWRYYNDGKQWLFNVSRKKKTLFWLSVKDGSFRTSFYFNAKAAPYVPGSGIPNSLKEQFKKSAGKKFRAITTVIKTGRDLAAYRELLLLKMMHL